MTRSLTVLGGGGVGKTTISAALGVVAAEAGLETLVMTVDPARRLADALGLGALGNEPQPTGVPNLSAMMLDAESSWENIIRRHAPPDVAERLLASEFFEAVAARFPSSQSYAASEEMAGLVESGRWDLVVIDTPPAAGGIGFFTAPTDMAELVGGNVLRWLTGRSGRIAGRPALRVADNILGTDLLGRVAEFLADLRTTYDGIVVRSRDIEQVLAATTSVVVTTAEPTPLREAAMFYRELPSMATSPALVVFNRALPTEWITATNTEPGALGENFARWSEQARHQAETRASFTARYEAPIGVISWQPNAPTHPAALAALLDGIDVEGLLGERSNPQ